MTESSIKVLFVPLQRSQQLIIFLGLQQTVKRHNKARIVPCGAHDDKTDN